MEVAEYLSLRERVFAAGYADEYEWAQNVKAPADADEFALEYIWVVCCSGMKEQIARIIQAKIHAAIKDGRPIRSAFGHPGKAAAIQTVWDNRNSHFVAFQMANDILAFCKSLPWIGDITKYHLAKNLGADVAKPDRWLERVAARSNETPATLCQRLHGEVGDRIATVDLIIWRACNLGFWP